MNCACCSDQVKAVSLARVDFTANGTVYHSKAPLCQVCGLLFDRDIDFHQKAKQLMVAKALQAYPPRQEGGFSWA